ncbi:MAG TPA: dihydrolipoamide acetyltransferase family protein [Pseudonocardiaceae bacterium]
MAPVKQFPLPDVGEGLTEAEILSWHVKPGDAVRVNQIIVEIETAKAAVELPCPWAGVITELFAEPGTTVQVGAPLVGIDLDPSVTAPAEGDVPSSSAQGARPDAGTGERVPNLVGYGPRTSTAARRPRKGAPSAAPVGTATESVATESAATESAEETTVPQAKPPVRKLARELGIDLHTVLGSGSGGVITREDVERARGDLPEEDLPEEDLPEEDLHSPAPFGGNGSGAATDTRATDTRQRREPIRGVRKATAAAMVASAFTAPHVTEFLTLDVTPMMELRARLKQQPQFRDVKLTPLAFAAKAMCLAVRRTPEANARWDEAAGEIVYFDYVHLGIAAATPRGLVVPKIRDADGMSLRELAVALETLTTTAREGRTSPGDMADGTTTITNVGVYGVDTGTPILNPGESAILALGAIRDMPWVVDGAVVPRKVCQLALSFDHRVVDGQQGSRFLADLGALLADPALALTY